MSSWFGTSSTTTTTQGEREEGTTTRTSPKQGGHPKVESMFREEAIPLVEVDEENKFHIGEEARAILGGLQGKVCVVSVAGLYRTGKSSLVNFLLSNDDSGPKKGFTVGPTVRRCTRGIWFWGSPKKTQLPSGEPCWVVVLDTEGLGGLEADQHYDTRIFSLATLLCSTMVYNSLGSIDEGAITNLSFVANLSQHIRVNEGASDEIDVHDFHKFFPSFVWVVRDFALDLVDEDGVSLTADEYLERSLRAQVGFDAATTERNRVRSMLTAFFTDRACFPLVRPLLDESKLQRVDEVPFESLRQEFRDGVDELKRHIYETHLHPKEIHGRPLNGASFLALAEQYVQAIEHGGVPTISTAWEEVTMRECDDALKLAIEAYLEDFNQRLKEYPVASTDKLYKVRVAASKYAHSIFRQRAAGDAALKYQQSLDDTIEEEFDKYSRSNLQRSNDLCHSKVSELHDTMVEPKLNGVLLDEDAVDLDDEEDSSQPTEAYADVASLKFDVQTIASKYAAQAAGPAKDAVLCEYALNKALDSAQRLFERLDDQHERVVAKLEKTVSESASERAKLQAREKVVADALEAQQKELVALSSTKMQLEAQAKASEARISGLFAELQRANRRKEELEQDLEDAKEALDAEQTWQAQLHQRLEDMETKTTHKESKLDELGLLLDQHKTENADKSKELERQRELEKSLSEQLKAVEAERAELHAAHSAAKEEHESVNKTLNEIKEEKARQSDQLVSLTEKNDDLKQQLAVKRQEAEDLRAKLEEAVSSHGASARELESLVDSGKKDLEKAQDTIKNLESKLTDSYTITAERDASLEKAQKETNNLQAELDGAKATHAELSKAHSQLATEHRAYQQKMNQRVTYLKTQLDEHQSTSSSTTTELQRKAVREVELEKRLEVEINLRASLQSEKDAQIFDLQKKLAEISTRLRQAEGKATKLKASLDASSTELNQVAAQRAVLLDEKDKMQALWEKSLTDHFNSLHETQNELESTKTKIKDTDKSTSKKVQELEAKLAEYQSLVEKFNTKKEGLLRKRTRSRLVKQTWHVKLFKLVGNALLHRDTDNDKQGEKTFTLVSDSICEPLQAADGKEKFVKNSFKVTSGDDELTMAAIDRLDMQEWIDAILEQINDLKKADASKEEAKRRFQVDPLDD